MLALRLRDDEKSYDVYVNNELVLSDQKDVQIYDLMAALEKNDIRYQGKNMPVFVTKICKTCGQVIEMEVNEKDLVMYCAGVKKVQDAFPYLKPAEREMFVSGICGDCFDAMFADYKEE